MKSPQRVHHCEETLFSWWWRSLLGRPTFVFLVRLFCFSLFLFVLLCPLSNSFSNKVDQNSPLVMKKTRKVSPKSCFFPNIRICTITQNKRRNKNEPRPLFGLSLTSYKCETAVSWQPMINALCLILCLKTRDMTDLQTFLNEKYISSEKNAFRI